MSLPPFPPDELRRLAALDAAAILDTDVEEFFEDIADSVQQVVAAPVVLVALLDEHRQWFKARRGMDVQETLRADSICTFTILGDAPLLVTDARLDARFRHNPLVAGPPNIVSYAGAPIRLEGGAAIGTVCAIDMKPRSWTDAEVAHIQRNARLVGRHIDTRRAHIERDRHRFLEASLDRAETRYKSVLESMSEGMVVQGPSGAIIDSNPAACAILGLTEDELFGRASPDPRWRATRQSGEDFAGEEHPAMVTLRTGEPQHGVVMGIETPTGERRWISINSYPVRMFADRRVQQVVTVFHQLDDPAHP